MLRFILSFGYFGAGFTSDRGHIGEQGGDGGVVVVVGRVAAGQHVHDAVGAVVGGGHGLGDGL